VSWGERGVVTGTVMFCRYLGQSLGAAVFGAIFNAAISGKLAAAPAALRDRLPRRVGSVGNVLGLTRGNGPAAGYVRDAVSLGIRHVYLGLAVAALATLAAAACIVPRRFSTAAGGAAHAPVAPSHRSPATRKP
jgi:hypothetical protein